MPSIGSDRRDVLPAPPQAPHDERKSVQVEALPLVFEGDLEADLFGQRTEKVADVVVEFCHGVLRRALRAWRRQGQGRGRFSITFCPGVQVGSTAALQPGMDHLERVENEMVPARCLDGA
jgi:hypothetical protein